MLEGTLQGHGCNSGFCWQGWSLAKIDRASKWREAPLISGSPQNWGGNSLAERLCRRRQELSAGACREYRRAQGLALQVRLGEWRRRCGRRGRAGTRPAPTGPFGGTIVGL